MNPHGHRGRFGYQCVAGAYNVEARDIARDEPVFGLPLSNTFVYGTVRDVDGSLFLPMRRIKGGDGGHERLLLQSSLDADAIRVHPVSRRSARSTGTVRSWGDGDGAQLRSAPDVEGESFEVACTAETLSWHEGDTVALTGALVAPGLHWHLPDDARGMYYASRMFEVEGTILGREVRGFIAVDDLYMHGTIYVDDVLVGEQAELVWYTWATRYDDGTLDGGHFMYGHDRLGFALLTNERGEVTATTEIDGEVTLDSDGPWPEGITLRAGGDTWEFVPDPRGRMIDLMPIPNPQVEGRWRRVGDDRRPAHWFAWGEIAPGHGTSRRRA